MAIALHLFVPIMGRASHGATSAAIEPRHDHAAHSHHEHGANPTAEHAPLDPDLLCVGDCPWCSSSDRPAPLLARRALALVPALQVVGLAVEITSTHRAFQAGTQKQSRAPPLSA